ncbi:hypothetical protein PHYPSEUDO_014107 [Phytophthora pseudosyringae]|uniref:FYVE-type domain-containing protein n=1 Tax=Phytophthora pseudosyringae TaxID=221518 RepID=A0A8T1W6P1_9STRA|nr:hypothetical protein PHYPSEUDO_014107 [Phytophthora pseudosyringae]
MKSGFTITPFPDLRVSNTERQEMIDLVDNYVDDYIEKYKNFVVKYKCKVNKRRWQHVKSRDKLHVYAKRSPRGLSRRLSSVRSSRSTSQSYNSSVKDLSVLLGVGTFAGELEDLMFGLFNPTLDAMRIKASYVQDFDNAAVLCSIVEPSKEEPFQSLVIKWMSIDPPLQATKLAKSRDFVFIEATGVVEFEDGECVGYQFLHSIDFPQARPLPNKIRGNLSAFNCFRQIGSNTIGNFACATVDPGGDAIRFLLTSVVANFLLSPTNYVYCGQMKKLSWLLQHRRSVFQRPEKERNRKQCVVCRKNTGNVIGSIGRRECKLCGGDVCYSCKIHQRLSFLSICGELVQRKVVFCGICISASTCMDVWEPATHEAKDYEASSAYTTYIASSTYTFLDFLTPSLDGVEL